MSDVLALPLDERLRLVGDIWDSIASAPEAIELTQPQRDELEARLTAYRRNPAAGAPWPDVRARLLDNP